jgi:protein kinase A
MAPVKRDTIVSASGLSSKKDTDAEARRAMASTGMSEFLVSSTYPWLLKSGSIPYTEAANMVPIRVIGQGSIATIRLARWTTNFKRLFCAVKEIPKADINPPKQKRMVTERNVLLKFNSPFIIKLFGTFQNDHNISMLLQYCPGGGLSQLMTERSKLKPQEALFVAVEVLSALEHIHEKGMIYRNLAPENIVIDESGHIKLVGFHYITTPPKSGMCMTICGLPTYHAPEQLNLQYLGGYSKCIDFWAFGCLVYELISGRPPFCSAQETNSEVIYSLVQKYDIKFTSAFDENTRGFILGLLTMDIKKRCTDLASIKQHMYFKANHIAWEAVVACELNSPFVPMLSSEGDRSRFPNSFDDNKEREPFKPCMNALSKPSVAHISGF